MSHWTHFVTEEDINASNPKAEWKAFLDSLPAWQRQWSEAPLRRLKERKDKAFECEAQSAEHKGLSKLVNLGSLRKS